VKPEENSRCESEVHRWYGRRVAEGASWKPQQKSAQADRLQQQPAKAGSWTRAELKDQHQV